MTAYERKLHYYKIDMILENVTALVWSTFKSASNKFLLTDQQTLQMSYGHFIVLNRLNDSKKYPLIGKSLELNDFNELLKEYNDIKQNLAYEKLIDCNTINSIKLELTKRRTKNNKKLVFEEKYIDQFDIDDAGRIWIASLCREQLFILPNHIHEILRSYLVFSLLDKNTQIQIEEAFIFKHGINYLIFLRACLSLFALFYNCMGGFSINNYPLDAKFSEKYAIDKNIINKVATNLSWVFDELKEFNSQEYFDNYSNFFTSKLLEKPLIYEKDKDRIICLSPILFLEKIYYELPSIIFDDSFRLSRKNVGNYLGNAVEDYVYKFLKKIENNTTSYKFTCLNESEVQKNKTNKAQGKKGDFLFETDNFILVAEIKTSIGHTNAHYLQTPKHIAQIASQLYEAIEQLSSSCKKITTTSKIIVPILIIADHINVSDYLPHLYWIKNSSMLEVFFSADTSYVQILSLSEFERYLNISTIENLLSKIHDRWSVKELTFKQILEPYDDELKKLKTQGEHNYEHLEEINDKYFHSIFKIAPQGSSTTS